MINEVKNQSKDDEKYEIHLEYYFLHFEKIINNKKGRKIKIIEKYLI